MSDQEPRSITTSSRRRRIRPYRAAGLYSKAEPPVEWREAADTLRAQLVAARGGQDEVTVQEGVLIDLIVGTDPGHQLAVGTERVVVDEVP